MELKLKKISIHKINNRFVKIYGNTYDTYYWDVKIKNIDNNKVYLFKAAIDTGTDSYCCPYWPKKQYRHLSLMWTKKADQKLDTDNPNYVTLIEYALKIIQDYLIDTQEIYSVDGNIYLIGESGEE